MKLLMGLCAVILLPGCLVVPIPRSLAPLAEKDRPAEPVALLPVDPMYLEVHESGLHPNNYLPKAEAQNLNTIGDTLARGKANLLIGPSRVKKLAQPCLDLDELLSLPAAEQSAAAETLARQLGVSRVVRLRPVLNAETLGVVIGPPSPGMPVPFPMIGFGRKWHGQVSITAELWDLCPLRMVRQSQAEAEFWGSHSYMLLLCGHVIWKTSNRAADEALRHALAELFHGSPHIPCAGSAETGR